MHSRARTAAALGAALLLPGLGHFALGRKRLAAGFFAIVAVTGGVGALVRGRLPEYGNTYLLCAAVMDLLLVLDVWERARGHKQ